MKNNQSKMKRILTLCFFGVFAANCFAQKEVFDLVTYSPPAGWTKEVTPNIVMYTVLDKTAGTWCKIGVVRSTVTKGGIDKDFEAEWQELVVKIYNPTEAPQFGDVEDAHGWKSKTGATKFTFNNGDALAMLNTFSGFGVYVSIIAITNNLDYVKSVETFIGAIEIKKPVIQPAPSPVSNNKVSITGTWGYGTNGLIANNRYGPWNYTKQQYTFLANGTYNFIKKVYMGNDVETLLIRETGTYVVSGARLTITPNKNVIEAWSKKSGGDNYNKLIKTQAQSIEKSNYSFYIYYDETLKITALMLQTPTETRRDGKYNAEVQAGRMWRYLQAPGYIVIKLPGE
jgi:hypothetical protein